MNGSTAGAFPRLVRGGWDSSSSCRTPIVATAESGFVAPLGDLYFELSGILCEKGGARVWAFSAANCSLSLHLCLAEPDPSERFACNFLAIHLELTVSLLLAPIEAVSRLIAAHLTPLRGFAPTPAVPGLLQLTIGSSGIEVSGRFLPRDLEVACLATPR